MKKIAILVLAILFLFPFAANAQVKKLVPNQSTMAWDPVTTMDNGDPIPATDEIKYEIFLAPHPCPYPVGDERRNDPNLFESQGMTDQTQFTITFQTEGSRIGGVRSLRIPKDAQGNVLEDPIPSALISWSDDPGVTSEPWYWSYWFRPGSVGGLRNSTIEPAEAVEPIT